MTKCLNVLYCLKMKKKINKELGNILELKFSELQLFREERQRIDVKAITTTKS